MSRKFFKHRKSKETVLVGLPSLIYAAVVFLLFRIINVCCLLICRVVNVSSIASKKAIDRCSEELAKQLKACTTISDLCGFITKFVT